MTTITDDTPLYKRVTFYLLSTGLVILLLYLGQEILLPLFFSILLASLLLPLNRFLERKGLHRVVAIMISIFLTLAVTASIIYFIFDQISGFFEDLPTINDRLSELSTITQKWIRETFNVTIRKQNQYVSDTLAKMRASGTGILGATVVTLTQALSYLILLPIYTFLILFYRGMIRRFLVAVFSDSRESQVKDILQESQAVSQSYILGLMIELAIVFGLNSAGFLILGIKYAVFLGLVAALLNLIPYIGMLIANLFCMTITLISCEVISGSDVLWVGIILAAVQFVDNNFLMPMIVGSKVRINALATIVGVLVGGALCGVPGMFLSIPGLAVLKVIFDRVEGLKPYGMLMGDERPQLKPKRIRLKKLIADEKS
ncbi:MAG: AI-2E family transporter [Cyclobacteriaceae bacterium]|nr:AI-2E family transporter [Cyclobacteriaceae bacterium]